MTSSPATAGGVPPPVHVPSPPTDPTELDPLFTTWAAGAPFFRSYDANFGSREFYASAASPGRFHPFVPENDHDRPLPVLYGASDLIGALSETVFHDVPVRGDKRVPYAKLVHRIVVELEPGRDLRLVDLTSTGLQRLGVSRGELIESDARSYPRTAAWARALHAHPAQVDGLTWVSRQHDTSRALVLFGDRVAVGDLRLTAGAVPLPLGSGAGLDAVCEAANLAKILITGLPA